MFDSHCHLNFKAFTDDAQLVAQEMADQQINGIVVGCDEKSTRAAISLAEAFPNLWASVGLHPIHVLDEPWQPTIMEALARSDRVAAIGEVGLDFYRLPEDKAQIDPYIAKQYEVFEEAIDLALKLNKPLIIHSREAYDEIIAVLKKKLPATGSVTQSADHRPDRLQGTVHCFMGNRSQAQQLLDLGFMIGFTGVITYKSVDPELLEVVKMVPLDRILIETDAPYLTPEPYRTEGKKKSGKIPRNIPAYVKEVARQIAACRSGQTTEEIIAITEQNGYRLFHLKDIEQSR